MVTKLVVLILAIVNITGFIIVALDKHKARKRKWRIPEKAFFIISILGGSPCTFISMLVFRHKTRHWYFMLGIPAIFLVQAIAAYYIVRLLALR
jgi:uncharacterized membrane protein YsdA (DUF1294 family)